MKDFFNWLKPLVRDLRDLSSWRIELIISPYFTCLSTCFRVSGRQPFGCLQNLVLAFMGSGGGGLEIFWGLVFGYYY